MKSSKKYLSIIITVLLISSELFAASGKGLDTALEDVKKNDNKQNTFSEMQPRLGLAYSPFLPMGEMKDYMDPGIISANAFIKINVPVKKMGMKFISNTGLRFTLNISAGISTLNSKPSLVDEASLQLLPAHAGMEFSYPLRGILKNLVLLSPYFSFDFGASKSSMEFNAAQGSGKESTSASSLDAIMGLSLGTTYRFKSLSFLEFFTDVRYLRFMEKQNSDFIMFNFGIGYFL